MYAGWTINGNHENEWQRVSECTLQIKSSPVIYL
jgi:hypothetical protein